MRKKREKIYREMREKIIVKMDERKREVREKREKKYIEG